VGSCIEKQLKWKTMEEEEEEESGRGWERSGEWEIIASEVRKEHKVKTKAAFKLFGFFTI
jgi:hypothetical protein